MSQAAIHYTVTPLIERNIFSVCMSVQTAGAKELEVYLPNWIAGSYMLRDFARHIVSIRVSDVFGKQLRLIPINQYTWCIENFDSSSELILDYEIYAYDTSVRAAFLNGDGGFFNGTSLFLSVKNLENHTHHLTLKPPSHSANWQVATTLSRVYATQERGFGVYEASSYDELVDHPVRMGHLTWLSFMVNGVRHQVAISSYPIHFNSTLLVEDLTKICEAQIDFFQDIAPFKQYLFLIDARSSGYGGLEHRDSTALLCSRDDLPMAIDSVARRDGYLTFLGLCSHEYFHAWNVKRIKPANFASYDLTRPIDTGLLWFFEGVTSYYDDLFLFRTGLMSEAQYFKRLENAINAVHQQDGRATQTLIESGFYAWTKYYQSSPNTPNAVVSYYTKGSLVALAMDLLIRSESHFQASLDDVMRDLWQKFGHDFYTPDTGQHGLRLKDIVSACVTYAPSINAFLNLALNSTDELPLAILFKNHEITLQQAKPVIQLGAAVKKSEGGYLIQRVLNHSAAQKVGLAPDDVLLTFNKHKIKESPDVALSYFKEGEQITIHFLRDDVLRQVQIKNQCAKTGLFSLVRDE